MTADFSLNLSNKTPFHHLCTFRTEHSNISSSILPKHALELFNKQPLGMTVRKLEAPATTRHQKQLHSEEHHHLKLKQADKNILIRNENNLRAYFEKCAP